MIKTARNLGILGILLALTGCSMATLQASVAKWGKVAEDTRAGLAVINRGLETVDDTITKVDEGVKTVQAEMKKADTDGDGKLSTEELLAWLAGSGGAGATLLALYKRLAGSTKEKETAKKAQEEKDAAFQKALMDLAIRIPAPPAPAV